MQSHEGGLLPSSGLCSTHTIIIRAAPPLQAAERHASIPSPRTSMTSLPRQKPSSKQRRGKYSAHARWVKQVSAPAPQRLPGFRRPSSSPPAPCRLRCSWIKPDISYLRVARLAVRRGRPRGREPRRRGHQDGARPRGHGEVHHAGMLLAEAEAIALRIQVRLGGLGAAEPAPPPAARSGPHPG